MLRRIDSPTTDAPGIIFVTKGVYTIRTDTALYKTVSVAQGGILSVAGGVTLTLRGQLSAGAFPIFQGPGRVRFQGGMPALLVDWFGAKGDGVLDDAPALNWALQAANDSDCEAVFSGKQYALGSTLFKGEGTRVFSRPGGWVGGECGGDGLWVGVGRKGAPETAHYLPDGMHASPQAIRCRGSSGGAWRRLTNTAPAAPAALLQAPSCGRWCLG